MQGAKSPSVLVALLAVSSLGSAAIAEPLPAIKSAVNNPVAACATPGRLQAFLQARNPSLDARFKTIAFDYMREGEALGVRWDHAFFHMMQETANLTFQAGARTEGLKAAQNNFAGIGAASGTAAESFADVATGVRAHLQHLLIYAGDKIDNAVAERTRKVQEWGVLADWQKGFKRPITYTDLAAKWAPKSKVYLDGLEATALSFNNEVCKKTDPNPEFAAMARGQSQAAVTTTNNASAVADKATDKIAAKVNGADLARRAAVSGEGTRSGLGIGVKILNPPPPQETQGATVERATPEAPKPPLSKTTSPTASAIQPQKCRVWTASYGGQRAVIVKAVADNIANFTVLDVNEGQETREADAFISAYAKGGTIAGSFTDQTKALDKAFELCPEG